MRVWIWLEHNGTNAYLAAKKKAERNARLLLVMLNLLLLSVLAAGNGEKLQTTLQQGELPMVELPILMYHSVLKDESRAGAYVISPEELEQDLLYLLENGYETVVMDDLIGYVTRGEQLPRKPVMLTFDDGHYNNLTYVAPLLQQYGMQAVISVIACYSEQYSQFPDPNPNYAYVSWEDVNKLRETGCVEVQNHSYDLHTDACGRKGAKQKRGESDETYREVFVTDTLKAQAMIETNCGARPTAYTYPFGEVCPSSEALLKEMGFFGSFSCREKVNRLERSPDSLFSLGRFNRPHGKSAEEILT
ncbi:MAG: polysaccharide deacetylase family protein [Eubacteriales bacterium]|nr:polysaccharide deacetylase family protein [Eubacteriales bacterium]